MPRKGPVCTEFNTNHKHTHQPYPISYKMGGGDHLSTCTHEENWSNWTHSFTNKATQNTTVLTLDHVRTKHHRWCFTTKPPSPLLFSIQSFSSSAAEYHLLENLTQCGLQGAPGPANSVSEGRAAGSVKPPRWLQRGACWKCRTSGPTLDLLNQKLHFTK